jgi:uncharacterized membrane protein
MREDWNGLSAFQVGSVLGVAWRTLFRAPGIFIELTFVMNLVAAIIAIAANTSSIAGLMSLWINVVLSVIIQGAISYAVFQVIMGGRASVGESVSKAASKIFALIAITFLYSVGVGFASILLIAPGLILFCMWYVSAPACVVERLGPIESLGRSRALTKGYRWRVFGVIILTYIFVGLTNGVFAILVRFLVPDIILRSMVSPIVTGLATLIPNAFWNVASAVVYYRLRMVKENLTMESLADVFD